MLINNAAWLEKYSTREPRFTKDDVEKTFATNYLGHFLLTLTLLDLLNSTANFDMEGRILFIASRLSNDRHKNTINMNLNDIQLLQPGEYNSKAVYKNSKTACLFFTMELHRRLQGTNITCNIVNPGNFIRDKSFSKPKLLLKVYIIPRLRLFSGKTAFEASSVVVFLATEVKMAYVSGQYFVGKEAVNFFETNYSDLGEQLWALSANLVTNFL